METVATNFHFHDLHPAHEDLHAEVIAGLGQPVKALSPKLFYDQRGSELFDAITRLPEYYPTRTEIALLERHGDEMAASLGNDSLLFEFGSGSDVKIRVLLGAVRPRAYAPIDISREQLRHAAATIADANPALDVHAVCADYSKPLALPELCAAPRREAFFPGSSIGNFDPHEAQVFLARAARLIGHGGCLLIGVDLKKDPALLNAAYNDRAGVTAAFNLNLLTRINRELDGDFDVSAFRHHAFYNAEQGRIEMHLVATSPQRVQIDGHLFAFRAGETIHTENSYKYSVEEFQALAAKAGFASERVWQDDDALFSVHCLRAR